MGLLSSSVSITRYKVEGKLEEPVLETIADGLKKNAISEIIDESSEKVIGWTSFDNPFNPDFEGSSFMIGTNIVFALRMEKKTIPAKILKKHCTLEMAKRLSENGRDYLSRNEKNEIKQHVYDVLSQRIPATPNIYDVLWNYEKNSLWFFSTVKTANEDLETLFIKSFKLNLIRLFPYTIADIILNLSDQEKDILSKLTYIKFTE